jgi:hypothetical protein
MNNLFCFVAWGHATRLLLQTLTKAEGLINLTDTNQGGGMLYRSGHIRKAAITPNPLLAAVNFDSLFYYLLAV